MTNRIDDILALIDSVLCTGHVYPDGSTSHDGDTCPVHEDEDDAIHPPFCPAFVNGKPCPKEWGHDNGIHSEDEDPTAGFLYPQDGKW